MKILRFYNSSIFQILIEILDWESKISLIPSQWTENNVSANLPIYHDSYTELAGNDVTVPSFHINFGLMPINA